MVKRLTLVLVLVMASMSIGGCRFMAPALESAGGYGGCSGGQTKSQMILRQWGRDARRGEEIVDTYLLNYDLNNPYRGDYYVLDGCR
jgi:hypothetical protein